MKTMRPAAICLILSLACTFCACDVAPHGKTVVLPRPSPSAAPTPAPPGKLSFELDKAFRIIPGKYDQAGYFGPAAQLVYGWLDNDRLVAIGVKPVAGSENDSSAAEKARMAKTGYSMYIGSKGLVGQILAVNCETGEAGELHTVQDEVVTSMGLSHDGTKLWYASTAESGDAKLSVSDTSFTHDLLEVSDFTGTTPVWSTRDEYLCYFFTSKSRPYLKVFDGTTVTTNPYMGAYMGPESQYFVDDDTGNMITLFKNILFLNALFPQTEGAKPTEPAKVPSDLYFRDITIPGAAIKSTWAGSGLLLCLSVSADGRSLYVLNTASKDPPDEYKGIVNYALSGDRKYICLVREAPGGLPDIYVGEWSGGIVSNEKLVFKGFAAEGPIYFSPDDTKLYMESRYGYSDAASTALVLKFK